MKVTLLPSVIGALETVFKRLVKGQKELEITRQMETIDYWIIKNRAEYWE